MMAVLNVGDLPSELTASPVAFVAIFGLDVSNNAVHAAIWDSFSASRQERAPLHLECLQDDHIFPEAKPKRTSYEWYVPKGILKTNWMQKHLTEVPAVAVQFVDLDWDDPHWTEKKAECENKVDQLRANLQNWDTKVALVLIQKRAALPGTEDQVAAERAASLCTSCNLSAKTLFVLPHSDHLFGYTLRLQTAFHELAQTYYHLECRLVRNHREFLNKTTHQLLFVRHQFKVAFLSEMKQDTNSALKNYKQAYANLMEVRASDANMLEIKTVAGFINYKICRLSFLNSTPLDAIAQFRKHVDIFKNKVGTQELAFEHSAWMSKQFSHFGDLFEEAVQQGLNAIQTQHPGFYYQQAANHAICRKQLCYKLCQGIKEDPNLDVLAGADNLEFFGQRPWRPCCQSLEPPDPQREQEGILALKYKELNEVNHSMIIIPLLSSAVAQFKKYKCPRMKRQLTVEMGEEYYLCKDYSKALTLLKHVLWDYRIEKWRPIVSSILSTALKCAFFSANVQDYISLGLESISNWVLNSYEEKANVQVNINNLVQGKPPYPLLAAAEVSNRAAEKLWLEALAVIEKPTIFTVQMASIIPFVECKAGFSSKSYFVDQRVTVTVYLRMNCPQPMSFSKLSVLYNNPKYNNLCELPMVSSETTSKKEDNNGKCSIYLIPRNTHTFTFTFIPDPGDIGKDIQITSVALQLGSEHHLCAVLHWTVTGSDAVATHNHSNPFVTKAFSFSDDPGFQHLPVQPSTSIIPRNALVRIEISHEPPALIDEFYAFTLNITNEEISNIDNVHLSVMLKEGQEQLVHVSTHLCVDPQCTGGFVQFLGNIPLPDMAPGESIKKTVYMKTTEVAPRKLVFTVTYEIKVEVDEQSLHCFCKKTQDVEVPVIEPFEFSVKLMNMKFELQESVRTEEPFLVKVDIVSCSPIPLILEGGVLELSHQFKPEDQDITTSVENVPLTYREAATECFCLVTPLDCGPSIPIGSYSLKWRRNSFDQECTTVETEVNLQSLDVTRPPIYMELECPAHGSVRTPMTITYRLYNRLFTVQDVELLVDSSDAFMYAGNKQLHFKIMPREKCNLMYNLYPLVPGYVPLPRLRLILSPGRPNALALDDLVHSMTPSHIFVMPQGKSIGNDPTRSV